MDRSQTGPPGSGNSDAAAPVDAAARGDSEASILKEQVKQGDLAGLRAYLARTRKECDWQDREFMLELITPSIRLAALDFACDTEPESADLFLIRCSFYSELAQTTRGSGTCDRLTEGKLRNTAECIQAALADLEKATRLDPEDPTPYAAILPALTIFEQLQPHQQHAFQQAVRLAPDLVPAYFPIVNTLAKRWYGSHEQSIEFARHAMTNAGPGSDMPACLFRAHRLAWSHPIHFDDNPREAERYLHNPEVTRELNAAFDAWTQPPYTPRRSSVKYLNFAAFWYYHAEDAARLKRALSITGNVFTVEPWSWIGDARKVYARAVQIAEGKTPPPLSPKPEPWEDSIGVVAHGVKAMEAGKFLEAATAFTVAFGLAQTAPSEEACFIVPLILLNRSLMCLRQRKDDEATKLREKAITQLDANQEHAPSSRVQRPLANVLYKLGDYRRALGFLEQAIGPSEEEADGFVMAEMLTKVGSCYNQMGLMDHAAVPLRAALSIYEAIPEDPRLANTLVTLGNSLRKSTPAEAEACYKRSADLRVGRQQYESACASWVNLGILYSETGRHAESLEHYERVLRVREQAPGTPPERTASLLNNMANCYRRMGNFPKAHTVIDRAIKLVSSKDAVLPSAYGTKAMIYLDAGEDKQAVEWVRKALREREKQPSPNLDLTVDNLETEITALKRLGRSSEAAIAKEKLASVRAAMQSARKMDGDFGAVKVPMEGAVLLELPFGIRPMRTEGRRSSNFLADMLSEEVRAQGVGYYGGWVAVPENTTLFFYGPDAEQLFKVLEPSLKKERVCAGARVLIRQGSTQREAFMQRQDGTLN
jgi:tetratricopeptide (TPR) repeat protein